MLADQALEPFFVTGHEPEAYRQALVLAHGWRQRPANLARSLTTASGVVAALSSMLAGSLVSDLCALLGAGLPLVVAAGAGPPSCRRYFMCGGPRAFDGNTRHGASLT